MNPNGYEKVMKALPDEYYAEPQPLEGEDKPIVSIRVKEEAGGFKPEAVINALYGARLLSIHVRDGGKPALELMEGLATSTSLTFEDLNTIGRDSRSNL